MAIWPADPPLDDAGRRPARPGRHRRTNLPAVALGLAAMMLLPLVVLALVPSGLAGTATRTRSSQPVAPARTGPISIRAATRGNRLGGPARVVADADASNGMVVQGIGRRGASHQSGTLTVPVTVTAAGRYLLTVYTMNRTGETARTLQVTVNDTAIHTIPIAGSAACHPSKPVGIVLQAGQNTITFANPRATGPSIDRITLEPA